MQFKKVNNSDDVKIFLSDLIRGLLKNNKQLTWFMCGGSNILVQAAVFNHLSEDERSQITIALTDERYVPFGDADSNQKQLGDAGIDFSKYHSVMPLSENQQSLEETAKNYDRKVKDLVSSGAVLFGSFGIGIDGHTAGIKPGHVAFDDVNDLAFGYEAKDFKRVTLSYEAIRSLDCACAVVLGQEKTEVLKQLQTSDLPLDKQPAQIFKQLPEVYIINEVIEGKL